MKNKKWLSFAVSVVLTLAIFAILFSRIDLAMFMDSVRNISICALLVSLLVLVPIFYISGYRWKLMISDYKAISVSEGIKTYLLSQSLNTITPSRIGDLGKAYFLRDSRFNMKIGAAAVILEKSFDLISILLFAVLGVLFMKTGFGMAYYIILLLCLLLAFLVVAFTARLGKGSLVCRCVSFLIPFKRLRSLALEMLSYFDTVRKDRKKVTIVILSSFLLWFLHLFQGYLFFWVVGQDIGFFIALGLIPIGILAGMIPVTIAGMGTRDAAFIFLFSSYAPAQVMILFGLIFSLRYVIPALLGLLWVNRYMVKSQ